MSKLQALREQMEVHQPTLQAYIFISDDPHCTQHLTNWDGLCRPSVALVTPFKAVLWVDEVEVSFVEVDDDWVVIKGRDYNVRSYVDWVVKDSTHIENIGFHPLYLPQEMWEQLKINLDYTNKKLIPVDFSNPFLDQSINATSSPIFIQPITYAGVSWEAKVERLREEMKKWGCSMMVVDALGEVAWLLNLRGRDVPFCLFFYAFVFLLEDSIHICVDEAKMDDRVMSHLTSSSNITIHPYNQATNTFKHLVAASQNHQHNKVWLSPLTSHIFFSLVPGERILKRRSEVAEMKMVKNPVEIEGMKRCHVRDGVATCQLLYWLETQVKRGKVVSQRNVVEQLEEFQKKENLFDSCSFEPICSSGPNSSIINYNPTSNNDHNIDQHNIFYLDAGAHFRDGTTDQARTLHMGQPSHLHREAFTLVLKSYITLQTAVFPEGINGCILDSLAKQHLWRVGLHAHTGVSHAVAPCLCVIEGPFGISTTITKSDVTMREGMVISIEPGFYERGKFGVRFENVVEVVTAKTKYNFEGIKFLTFEPLTLAPIQRDLINREMLKEEEVKWVDEYHARVNEVLGGEMRGRGLKEEVSWLEKQTRPLSLE